MKKTFLLISLAMIYLVSLIPYSPCLAQSAAASSSNPQSVDLPIVMYHSVLKSRQGKYTVSPAQLEQDFETYQKMGYTPVFLREVIDFVDGRGKLPQKPIVITFDDGHYNNMHYVLPIAQKFNFKIVINPVTSFGIHSERRGEVGNPAYSYLTISQMNELHQSGLVEIGNHTHSLHKFKPRYGIKKKPNESNDDYVAALVADIGHAQALFQNAGIPRPTTFAYPFGAYNEIARDTLIEMGFRALLTCNEGVSQVTLGDPTSLYYLKRYNRSGNTNTAAFVKKVFAKLEGDNLPK